jgi:hypothetical protein
MAASDFVLVHGNGQQPAGITGLVGRVRAMPSYLAKPKPIVFNEDDHGGLRPRRRSRLCSALYFPGHSVSKVYNGT